MLDAEIAYLVTTVVFGISTIVLAAMRYHQHLDRQRPLRIPRLLR